MKSSLSRNRHHKSFIVIRITPARIHQQLERVFGIRFDFTIEWRKPLSDFALRHKVFAAPVQAFFVL